MVNVAGKRSSLTHLNHQLTAIAGVVDAFFYLPELATNRSVIGTVRLAALVVAPGLTATEIIHELRARVDPVFLPRPLLLVETIPRNSTGKLPLSVLRTLTETAVRA